MSLEEITKISDLVLKEIITIARKKQANKDLLDESIRTVKDQHENDNIERVNEDGIKVTVKEKDLWTELYNIGIGSDKSDAEAILTEKYPDIFVMLKKDIELAKRFNQYCAENLGIIPSELSLVAIINLVLNLIDYRAKEIRKKK